MVMVRHKNSLFVFFPTHFGIVKVKKVTVFLQVFGLQETTHSWSKDA